MHLLLIAALFSWLSNAQDTRGQIFGSVQDSSGAAVAGALVRCANANTGVEVSAITNDRGEYILPLLLPGVYRVTIEHSGFKRFVKDAIEMRVSERIPVDVTLELGQVSETVQVQASAMLLETASASMGQVIDNRRITELPLKDGNPIMLANLAPGVLNLSTGGWSRPFDVNSPSSIAVDGSRTGSTEFTIDGAPNTQRTSVAYIPPSDIVQEFRIQTAAFDASQGFASGAGINVSIRSGTNSVHGTVYHFIQNPALNANRFFTNRAGLPKPIVKLNRWGVNGSGPVYLPKLYNGQNRTFWTYAYEGIYSADPRGTVTTAVPTSRMRQGDFSELLAVGQQYQLYDPATIAPAPNGRFSRQPIAGNVIPASRINATARRLMEFWPEPNNPATRDGANNWTTPGPEWDHFYTHIFRVDHNFNAKHRLFLRGDKNDRLQEYDVRFNRAIGGRFHRRNRGLGIDDVYVFSSSLVMNTRYSYGRFIEGTQPINLGIDLTSLGFSNTFASQVGQAAPDGVKFPQIRVSGYGNFGDHTHNFRYTDTHEAALNFTQLVRSHNLRYGYFYRVYRENGFNLAQSSGQLDFGADWTRGPLDNSPVAPMGQSLASFLLGLPTGGGMDLTDSSAQQSTVHALFFQDDWKLTRKLTLMLGLRYEYETPVTERYNRSVRGYDFVTPSPIEQQARANYARTPIPQIAPGDFHAIGGLTFAGSPRTLWNADKNNLLPRIGFAYQWDEKTVLRGGYGIFSELVGLSRQQVNQSGFSRNTAFVASIDNGQNFIATLTNPFPQGFDRPLGAAGGLNTFLGQGVSFYNPNILNPYMQRWQFSVQRALTRNAVIEVGYIGNRGTHLRIGRQLDATPERYYSTSPVRDQAAIDFLSTNVPNPFFPLLPRTNLSGANVARSQLLRPYPQFTSVTFNNNQGYSWYHSMQTRFEKRMSHDFTVNFSWTWAKFMEATGFLNDFDPLPEEVISDQDRPHRFVVTGLWELPLGQGKRFLNRSGVLNKVFGGWQTQAIYQYQSGPALGFGNAIFNGDLHNVPLSGDQRTIDRWFNIDAGFERATARQLGANVRRLPSRFSGIRGGAMDNWDISFFKNTAVSERMRLQFRCEFINAFNHTQFNPPNTTTTSSAFGAVTGESQWSRTIQFGLKLLF
ncbi:MAG: TonB-dependent receptor [Acidobacteria bacterium]|nr:TonB-dependent receptor [Acidobacteriota bacterium]